MISSLVLLLVFIFRFPMNELRVAMNAEKRLIIDNDSVTISKNASLCSEFVMNQARFFEWENSWPKF